MKQIWKILNISGGSWKTDAGIPNDTINSSSASSRTSSGGIPQTIDKLLNAIENISDEIQLLKHANAAMNAARHSGSAATGWCFAKHDFTIATARKCCFI